eukprot:gene4449-7824_t
MDNFDGSNMEANLQRMIEQTKKIQQECQENLEKIPNEKENEDEGEELLNVSVNK